MMNLQNARRVASGSIGSSRSISLVRFNRVVGSIGEPLELSIAEHIYDDDDNSDEATE